MTFCSLVMTVSSRTPRPGAAHPDHSAPGLGSRFSLMTPSVRSSVDYCTWSVTDPELAGRPGWANTSGEMPSRRQAMDRLIERWQELRRLSEGCGGPRPDSAGNRGLPNGALESDL